MGAELLEFDGGVDHVQPLVSYPPTLAISILARGLKGATACRLRTDYAGRCNRARMRGHFWTPSHFAVSAGGAPESIIKQNIEQLARPL